LQDVEIEGVEFVVRDQAAIVCLAGERVHIARNSIRVKQLAQPLNLANAAGFSPAIFLLADEAAIEDNAIRCDGGKAETTPAAGVQSAGGSTRVEVRRNRIEAGNGNGVTLGSVTFISQDSAQMLVDDYAVAMKGAKPYPGYPSGLTIDAGGCVQTGGGQNPADPQGNPLTPVSDGALLSIRILDNDIQGMGGSGVADLFLPGEQGLALVALLEIERNVIADCAKLDRGNTGAANALLPGRGGVALISSEYVTVRDNVIEGNGQDYTRSICGVWTGMSFGLVIERNRMVDNAPYADTNAAPEPGPRGGVVLEMALPFVNAHATTPVETGFPAARVHDNIVVSSSGPALAILAIGEVTVESNDLTSHFCDQPSRDTYPLEAARSFFGGFAAFVWNLSWPLEIASLLTDFLQLGKATFGATLSETGAAAKQPIISGSTAFNNNLVLLDSPGSSAFYLVSSVAILSLGDVSMVANQCDVSLLFGTFLIANALTASWSVRIACNRFQETLFLAQNSVASWAFMNTTTENQGTHCFFAAGKLLWNFHNSSLIQVIQTHQNPCELYPHAMQSAVDGAGLTLENTQ
jgi:hypothetical protein